MTSAGRQFSWCATFFFSLLQNPNEDGWKDPALEKLNFFCEESRNVNDWVPTITLPEWWWPSALGRLKPLLHSQRGVGSPKCATSCWFHGLAWSRDWIKVTQTGMQWALTEEKEEKNSSPHQWASVGCSCGGEADIPWNWNKYCKFPGREELFQKTEKVGGSGPKLYRRTGQSTVTRTVGAVYKTWRKGSSSIWWTIRDWLLRGI